MKRFFASLIIVSMLLSGCATTSDYEHWAKGNADIQVARVTAEAAAQAAKSKAEEEKYKTLLALSNTTDPSTRTAAVMAIAFMGINNGGNSGISQMNLGLSQPPKSTLEQVGDFASKLAPAVVAGVLGYYSYKTNVNASDNARMTSIATTDGFVQMGGQIQSPAANVTTTTNNTDRHDVFNSYNPDNSVANPAAP